MEQPTANNQDTFIERVRLQGYKSIEDVEITFKPGLNILIGANGSGKTNFVRFLDLVLKKKFDDISIEFKAGIRYHSKSKEYSYSLDYKNFYPGKVPPKPDEKFNETDDVKIKEDERNEASSAWFNLRPSSLFYGVPEYFGNFSGTKMKLLKLVEPPNGSHTFLYIEPQISNGLYELLVKIISPIMDWPNDENLILTFPTEIVDNLSMYTPVKDIRLAPGYRVQNSRDGKEIIYFNLEYSVNNQWRPWTHLSDGTKRLVYIITEVTFANNIILLEEPELGIHPHQLSKLMDFLEAAAEHKQIILTTHSPQVLNVLRTNELDRIIVVRYEKDNGTKMSHLTEEEQEKARTYVEVGGLDLSDYWMHSSLEKETESV